MSSSSILTQSLISDDQFITDVTCLFKRRNISFGEPKDLERLGSDLTADEALRSALFNLCTVISHMSEVEPTPQQLLALVARASGGPAVFNDEDTISIPLDTETVFLTGYEAWTHREQDLDAFSKSRHADPFHTALELSTAEGFHALGHRNPNGSSPRAIPTNAPLDSLTLAELRQYLDDIERRVSRIEPHLTHVEAAHVEPAAAAKPEPELAESTSPTTTIENEPIPAEHSIDVLAEAPPPTQQEPALTAPVLVSVAQPPTIQPQTESRPLFQSSAPATTVPPDAARLRRLRTANIILAILLLISTAFAGTVAFQYIHTRDQQPHSNSSIDQASTPQPVTEPPATAPLTAATSSPTPPPAPTPASPHAPSTTKPAPTPAPSTAKPVTPAPALKSEVKPPAPITRQAAEPQPSIPPAPTATPSPSLAEVKPPESTQPIPQPERRTEQRVEPPATRPATPPAPTQIAEARPAAIPSAPAVRTSLPSNLRVSVPSSTMMAYVLSSPRPIYPRNRVSVQDGEVRVVATISKAGKVVDAQAVGGNSDLRSAAILAIKAWRFSPYMLEGQPVEVSSTFRFVFKAPSP